MAQTPLQQRKEKLFNTELTLRGLRIQNFVGKFNKATFLCSNGHSFIAVAAEILNRPAAQCRLCVKQQKADPARQLAAQAKQKEKELEVQLFEARSLLSKSTIKIAENTFICTKAGHLLLPNEEGFSCSQCVKPSSYGAHVLYLYSFDNEKFGYGRAKDFAKRDTCHRHRFKQAGITATGSIVFTGTPEQVKKLEHTIYCAMIANNFRINLEVEAFRREAFQGQTALKLFNRLVAEA